MRCTAIALVGFAVLSLAIFRPTPSELAHTSPAFHGFANDALLLVWALAHVSRTLFVDPLHVFDAGIFHPARLTLAYSDHMIGQALVGLPVWLATGNPLLEFNLLVLGSCALGATAAFAYARAVGLGAIAAAVAGFVFAFGPYRFHSPLWLQVLFTPFVPLALLALLVFVRTRDPRAWIAWVLAWTLHGLMGLYLALYFVIVMGALVAHAALAAPGADRRLRIGLVAGTAAMMLLLAPTLAPYVILRETQGHLRTTGIEIPWSFLAPGPGTATAVALGSEALGRFGPGLSVWALALLGLLAPSRRATDPEGRFVRRAHLLGLAVTLALVVVPLRWQQLVPGLDMIRATNRAFYLSLFFLGLFAAEGVQALLGRVSGGAVRTALAIGVAALLLADMGTPPRERVRLPREDDLPAAYRALRELPADAVVYDRVDGPEPLARAMYLQTFHQKRMPTGYAGFWNPASTFATRRLYRFPAPESLSLARQLGVGWVLQHFASPEAAAAATSPPPPGVSVATLAGTDVVYRVEPAPPMALDPSPFPLPRDAWTFTARDAAEGFDALRDGDASTAWRTHATWGRAPAITIDLGAPARVTGVRCTAPIDDAGGVFLSRVETSEDGTTFTLAPAGFEPDSLDALYRAPRTVHAWTARFPAVAARWVRLSNGDLAFWTSDWVIGELDVLATTVR